MEMNSLYQERRSCQYPLNEALPREILDTLHVQASFTRPSGALSQAVDEVRAQEP